MVRKIFIRGEHTKKSFTDSTSFAWKSRFADGWKSTGEEGCCSRSFSRPKNLRRSDLELRRLPSPRWNLGRHGLLNMDDGIRNFPWITKSGFQSTDHLSDKPLSPEFSSSVEVSSIVSTGWIGWILLGVLAFLVFFFFLELWLRPPLEEEFSFSVEVVWPPPLRTLPIVQVNLWKTIIWPSVPLTFSTILTFSVPVSDSLPEVPYFGPTDDADPEIRGNFAVGRRVFEPHEAVE